MIKTVLTVILVVICVLTIIVVMMQQGSEKGLGAISGISIQDTYWGKNKGRSKEGRLKKLTAFLVAAFIGLSLLLDSSFITNMSSKNSTETATSTSAVSTSAATGGSAVTSGSNAVK